MSSITKRPRLDGTFAWQVKWRERGQQTSTTCDTERAAKRVKSIVDATGTYADEMGRPDVPTVSEQAEAYLASHTRANPATVREYRRIIDQHIVPTFGELAVTSLTVPLLARWGRELDMSAKTRANVTAVLSGILESAVPDYLPANPWRKVRLPSIKVPKVQHFLTWPQFRILLDEIPDHYKPLVATLGMTGMRWGEAAALTVADVNLSSGLPVFDITKAVKHRAHQGDRPGVPKTEKAVRRVTGPVDLVEVLRPLLDRPPNAPLFPTVQGKRVRNSTFHTLIWQPAVGRAVDKGLPFRPRVHDLRAAATTWLLEAGMRPDEVADLMGHESIDTTLRIYRRSNPEAGRRAAEIMSSGLRRAIEG